MISPNETIAREAIFGLRKDGERFIVSIEIGKPFKWGGTCATEWACAVKVEPFHSHTVHGEGSFQALCLALWWVRAELDRFKEEGGVLLWESGEEWRFEDICKL